jgi:hypothetical protein
MHKDDFAELPKCGHGELEKSAPSMDAVVAALEFQCKLAESGGEDDRGYWEDDVMGEMNFDRIEKIAMENSVTGDLC